MRDKLNRIDSVPDDFILKVEKSLSELFDLLLQSLQLEQAGGSLVRNEANILLINLTMNRYRELFYGSDYIQAVKDFSAEFDKQKAINDTLLRGLGYPTTATNLAIQSSEFVFAATRRSAIELLIGDANVNSRFFSIIKQTLLDSVNTGTTYTQMVRSLSNVVLGDSRRQGQLLNWSKQVAHDSFAMADAEYSYSLGNDLGVEWYLYAGGLIKDSREFCVARNGKYFHKSEVEAWANLGNWDGRMPNTNSKTIFAKRGGYRCNHTLVFVSEAVVPQDVINRVRNK